MKTIFLLLIASLALSACSTVDRSGGYTRTAYTADGGQVTIYEDWRQRDPYDDANRFINTASNAAYTAASIYSMFNQNGCGTYSVPYLY